MVPSISTILRRFTGEWALLRQTDAMLTVCREIGYTTWRDRLLTPVTTTQLFLLQILHGHTACSHLPHLSGWRFRAAAYGQARARLPRRFFDLLLERFASAAQSCVSGDGRWPSHRTFFVDGSGCSMPDTPALQDRFGQPTVQRPGCGVPMVHLLGLFQAGTGMLLKLAVAPLLTHDLAQVPQVHPGLAPGDVLVADRGLCSYAHLALLAQAGVHAVLRGGARQIVDFTPGRPFVTPGVRRTPAVRGMPRSRWHKTLGVHDQQRWQVETSLAQLKTTMKMDVLHCKTVPGVLKELTIFAIVYNLVRMVIWPSATLQHIGVERISFLDALRWLGALSTRTPLGALIVNPERPHRVEPRVKKRRPKPFPLMITPRHALRQQLVQYELRGSLHAIRLLGSFGDEGRRRLLSGCAGREQWMGPPLGPPLAGQSCRRAGRLGWGERHRGGQISERLATRHRRA